MRFDNKVVVISDLSGELGNILMRRFKEEGALTVGIDSLQINKSAVERFVEKTVNDFGKIDVLIHCDNYVSEKSIENCSDADFDKSLDINAKSAFLLTQAVGRVMKERRYGKILYISSIHDEKPNGFDFCYSVAKGAVKMLMREACLDLGIYGINVNILNAGALEGDDMRFKSNRSALYEQMYDKIPCGKANTNDDIAGIALFLCADECCAINGADITADRGFLKSYFPRYNYEEYADIAARFPAPKRGTYVFPEKKLPQATNNGKVAVVTGAATSIGQGVALALAKEGVKVVVGYNSVSADETLRLIDEVNGEAIAVKADVSDREQVKNLFKTAFDNFGEIDLLVNNAAVQLNLWLLEYSEEQYDRLMQINVKGYFICMQEALAYMKKEAFARIVNTASIHAERPTNFDIVYSMTKGGVKMLTREAALELSKYDITVNQLDLGAIMVPSRSGNFISKPSKPLEFKNRPKGGFLSGRYGYPFDVGYIVSFLLDERSQFINGSSIRADGGAMNV